MCHCAVPSGWFIKIAGVVAILDKQMVLKSSVVICNLPRAPYATMLSGQRAFVANSRMT